MDYMNLGVTSRKTGIRARDNIEKDEYSMENVDDFFKEEEESFINTRRKSRRSSLLPGLRNSRQERNILPPSLTVQAGFDRDGFKIPSTVPVQTPLGPSAEKSLNLDDFPQIDDYDAGDNVQHEGLQSPPSLQDSGLKRKKYTADYDLDLTTDDASIHLTPPRESIDKEESYKDVPDLIDDAETTRDNTTFNTSDNALLEDELDDDYEVESEEDAEYIEGMSALENGNSSSDEDSSSESGSDVDSFEDDAALSRRKGHSYTGDSPSEVYDSDEEYIQSQAPKLLNDESLIKPGGLRKSTRVKVAPLEYWRNEKVVYKRNPSKPVLEIDKIITYDNDDQDEEEEVQKNKKTRVRARPYTYIPTGKPRGRPKKHPSSVMGPSGSMAGNPNYQLIHKANTGELPHSEWLKHGILQATVNVSNDRKSDTIVAFAPDLAQAEQSKDTEDDKFSLAVMFDKYREHFASGMLKLPVGGKKKMSDSHDAFITFYLVQGIVEITLSGNKFICTEGSSFQIPAFNTYGFENNGKNEAKLFFVQVTVSESLGGDDKESDVEVSEKQSHTEAVTNGSGIFSSPSDMSISEA